MEATATVIGLFERWQCLPAPAQLGRGDLLAVFSDGVVEAAREDEEFGEQRLMETLRAQDGVDAVLDRVQRFSTGAQGDDLILLIARIR